LVRSENLLGGLGWLAIAISVTDFCSKQKMGRGDDERFAVRTMRLRICRDMQKLVEVVERKIDCGTWEAFAAPIDSPA
jgi:hypothetical protein